MPINLDIPRTMTLDGLRWLERLASHVPEDGVILEVGPLYGSSTWTLAKSAHPSVTVYSIDTWKRAPWIIKNVEEKLGAPEFSIDAFKAFISDCPNVVPIQGHSPEAVEGWDRAIDLFFDDAAHGNPGFVNNLEFFRPHVTPGGVLAGDDYALGSPDIVREVDALAQRWSSRAEVAGRVWALRTPPRNDERSRGVSSGLQLPAGPSLTVTTYCDMAEPHEAPPNVWSGQLQKPGRLRAFSIAWCDDPGDLDVVYRCANRSRTSRLCRSGELCYIEEERQPITSVTVDLVGSKATDYDVAYQAGIARDATVAFKQKFNTAIVRNGRALEAPTEHAHFSALRVMVGPTRRLEQAVAT